MMGSPFHEYDIAHWRYLLASLPWSNRLTNTITSIRPQEEKLLFDIMSFKPFQSRAKVPELLAMPLRSKTQIKGRLNLITPTVLMIPYPFHLYENSPTLRDRVRRPSAKYRRLLWVGYHALSFRFPYLLLRPWLVTFCRERVVCVWGKGYVHEQYPLAVPYIQLS